MRSAEEIIEKLRKSFNAPSTKDEKAKVVVICIIISTTFWFFSALNKSDYVTQINYPLKVSYNDSLYIATKELPDHLPLEVTGGGWDLMTRSFGFSMEPLEIELENPIRDSFRLSSVLRQEIAPKLDPVLINYILEDSVVFHIDKRITRTLTVAFDSSSVKLAPNYKVTSPVVLSPTQITVQGPESLISKLDSPFVIRPGEKEFSSDVNEKFTLSNLGSDLIKPNVGEVNVKFEVTEFLQKSIDLPVYRVNFKKNNVGIVPSRVLVAYEISEKEDRTIDSTDLVLMVDFLNMQKRDSTIPIEVTLKSPIVLNPEFSPKKVKVVYE